MAITSWIDPNQVQATASVVSVALTLVYVVVTFVGFLLLRHQIRQVELSARGETHSHLYTQQQSITTFFIANPTLRPFFYDNGQANGADEAIVRPVAELVADFCEHIFLQLPNLPGDIRDGWQFYLLHLYDSSPILRQHFEKNGGWYSEELLQMLRAHDTTAIAR